MEKEPREGDRIMGAQGGRRRRLSARLWQGCACRTSWVAPPAEQGHGRAVAAAARPRTTSALAVPLPTSAKWVLSVSAMGAGVDCGTEGNKA